MLPALERQAEGKPVEVLALADNARMSIGEKMTVLYRAARGEYVAGVGDDDIPADDYIDALLGAIGESDVVTFDVDWQAGEPFLDWPVSSCEFRPMAAVRTEIARRFEFPDWWQSEDRAYSTWLRAQNPTVTHISKILYGYQFRKAKPEFGGRMYAPQSTGSQSRESLLSVVVPQLEQHV